MDKYLLEKELLSLVSSVLKQEISMADVLLAGNHIIDSMNIMELIVTIERTYHISFEDDLDLDYLDDMKSLFDAVFEKISTP